MPSEADTPTSESSLRSSVRSVLSIRNMTMLCAGVVAGASLTVLGEATVAVPFLGSASGTLLGVVGLVVAFAVYQQGSCCDDRGTKDCGCTGRCGDSCSYDS
jgi:hypothetical protein